MQLSLSLLSGEGCYQPGARSWEGSCIWLSDLCPIFVPCLSNLTSGWKPFPLQWNDEGTKTKLKWPKNYIQRLQLSTCLFSILSQITIDWYVCSLPPASALEVIKLVGNICLCLCVPGTDMGTKPQVKNWGRSLGNPGSTLKTETLDLSDDMLCQSVYVSMSIYHGKRNSCDRTVYYGM